MYEFLWFLCLSLILNFHQFESFNYVMIHCILLNHVLLSLLLDWTYLQDLKIAVDDIPNISFYWCDSYHCVYKRARFCLRLPPTWQCLLSVLLDKLLLLSPCCHHGHHLYLNSIIFYLICHSFLVRFIFELNHRMTNIHPVILVNTYMQYHNYQFHHGHQCLIWQQCCQFF